MYWDSYRQHNDLLPIEDITDLLNLCLDQLAFNSVLNDTKSYIVQVWRRHFPLLSRNCWCRTSRNAPFRLADERYHLGYVDEIFTAARHDEFDEFHHHFKEQISEIHFSREVSRKRINTRFTPLVFQKTYLCSDVYRQPQALNTRQFSLRAGHGRYTNKPNNCLQFLKKSKTTVYIPTLHKATKSGH